MVLVSLAGVFSPGGSSTNGCLPFCMALVAALAGFRSWLRAGWLPVYAGWAIIAFFTAVSGREFEEKGFSLHFYDLVFVSGDPEVYRFSSAYLYLILPVASSPWPSPSPPRSLFPRRPQARLADAGAALAGSCSSPPTAFR